MSEPSALPSAPDTLDIQDYLEATSHAADRTRWVTLVMLVTSMAVFAGLLNSLGSQWMGERVRELTERPFGTYAVRNIGPLPTDPDHGSPAWERYARRVDVFQDHLTRAYVETGFVIRVPVVGFTLDVNDLGLIGGVAFIVILLMLRFSLTRELDNVRLSFERAEGLGRLHEFYTLLAMRQVFTVPPSPLVRRTRLLVWAPKAMCALPLVLQLAVTNYDFYSSGFVFEFSWERTTLTLVVDVAAACALFPLTLMDIQRLRKLDELWAYYWCRLPAASRT
jgi:hypothetical protein